MFEKEKRQYTEDCKVYVKPWALWQYSVKDKDLLAWQDLNDHPQWADHCVYRRKINAFVPEYYSGLNWREADHLVGKTVECSNNPDAGWKVGKLQIVTRPGECFNVDIGLRQYFYDCYTYIRTCEETFKHPTINIGGVELPKPETVAPELGTKCWFAPACNEFVWGGYNYHIENLQAGRVHLTEERAKAWADWWKATVIDKMK